MKSTETSKTDKKSLDLIYEISRDKLKHLYEIADAQERKAATFITAISVILATIYFLYPKEMEVTFWKFSFFIIIAVAVVTAALGLLFCIKALRVEKYSDPPNISGLRNFYIRENLQKTKDQMVANLEEAVIANKKFVARKAKNLSQVAKRILPILVSLIILSVVVRAVYLLTNLTSKQGVHLMKDEKNKPNDVNESNEQNNDNETNQPETDRTQPDSRQGKGKTQPDPRLRDKIPLKKEPRSANN